MHFKRGFVLLAASFVALLGVIGLATPASAATTPTITPNPIYVSCSDVVPPITISGLSPNVPVDLFYQTTGVKIPLPTSAIPDSAGTVTIPSITIPGAHYVSIPLNLVQGNLPAIPFNILPPITACPLPSLAPASTSSSSSATPAASTSSAADAPTQSASSASFTPGSGSTGDDAIRKASNTTSLSGLFMALAAAFGALALGAGAVHLRKGRAQQ
jgi:hypothetical protein